MSYLNHHQLLNLKQSGFRSGHSTDSALLHIADTWLQAINGGNIVDCVFNSRLSQGFRSGRP